MNNAKTTAPDLQCFRQLIESRDLKAVEAILNNWPAHLQQPEALELRGLTLKKLGRNQEAIAVLSKVLEISAGSAAVWQAVIELNYLEGRRDGLNFTIATASRLYPRDPVIASHRVLVKLHERLPAQARRSSFQERLLYSFGVACHSREQSDGNLLSTYDQTGRSDLVSHLHRSLVQRLPQCEPLHTNLAMQLASVASPYYGECAEQLALSFPVVREFERTQSQSNCLRVGLLSPDFSYHPVGRFIQMLMETGFGSQGAVHLINTGKPSMQDLENLAGENHHNLSHAPINQRLDYIRSLSLDVAIDLTGWTGQNNGSLFASRIAPLQINYLGYFASTGLPAMDIWLGDKVLFPDPIQEWHSERIIRLNRPFLAWSPTRNLPEGRVGVPPAPSGAIKFGCFNHVRKLSSATLKLWAKLLTLVPNSELALKSYTSDDPGVISLLETRMRSCGLDPAKVTWLPLCGKPEDHLRQYGLIDVALDPFPNGGCTTTCEALWMGVPVITLCGHHYVSRMASAVLEGAQLGEWIAHTLEQYLDLGVKAAENLSSIRENRQLLRSHLQASPLGDAEDWANQLWQCLEELSYRQQAC